MLKMVTFTIGMEKDAKGNDISRIWQAKNKGYTMSYLSDLFGGCTVLDSEGAWMNSKGELVTEKGITVKVAIPASKSITDVMAIADNINLWHEQESILVEYDGMVYFTMD